MAKFTQPVTFCLGQQTTRLDWNVGLHPLPHEGRTWTHLSQQSCLSTGPHHQSPLVLKQLLALFSTSISSAQGRDADYQIANFNYYLARRKQNQLHVPLPQGEKKTQKPSFKTKQQTQEHCLGREIKPPSNKTVSAAFLASCVFLFFLRAITFSILEIVGCFMEQKVWFARIIWLERGTSFWRLPGYPN